MTAFPQYAKTTNPDVIAAVTANREGVAEFHEKACAFAIAQGAEGGGYYRSSFGGTHAIRAIAGDEKPTTGRWKQGHGGYGWLPFKSNPITTELDAIRFVEQAVPGLPELLDGPDLPDGRHALYSPNPFLWDGAVYVGFSAQPVDRFGRTPDWAAAGWEEIKASEYWAAAEAVAETLESETAA